ncbi:hypothetical protein D3C72_1053560 [compost metagenome]
MGARRHPEVGGHLGGGHVDFDSAAEHVDVGFHVLGGVADVDPVGIRDVTAHPGIDVEEVREEAALEHVGLALGDVLEDVRVEHVDAGVHRVDLEHRGFLGSGFLVEAGDPLILVEEDQAELRGVLHLDEGEGGLGLGALMGLDDGREVDVREHVAVEDQHGLVGEVLLGVLDRAGGAQGLGLVGVEKLHAVLRAVTQDVLDGIREVVQVDDDLFDPVLA